MSNQGNAEAAVSEGSKVMKVVTSDGKEFEVSTKILKMFSMVKDMLALGEGGGAIDLEDGKPFQLLQGKHPLSHRHKLAAIVRLLVVVVGGL